MSKIIFILLFIGFDCFAETKQVNNPKYSAGDDIFLKQPPSEKLEFIHPFGKIILKNNSNQTLIDSSLTTMSGTYSIQSSLNQTKSIDIEHSKTSKLSVVSSASILDVTKNNSFSVHSFPIDRHSNITDSQTVQFSIEYPSGEIFSKSCEHYNLICFTKFGNFKKSGVVTIKANSSSVNSKVNFLQQASGPVFSYKIQRKKRETVNLKESRFFIKINNIKDQYDNIVENGTKISLLVFNENNIIQTIERVTVEGSASFYFTASNTKKIVKIQFTSNKYQSDIIYEEFI